MDCMIRRILRQRHWLQIIELCKLQGVFPLICVFSDVFLSFFVVFIVGIFHLLAKVNFLSIL